MRKSSAYRILIVLLITLTILIFILVNPNIKNTLNAKFIDNSVKYDEFPEKAFVSKVIDGDTVIINGESVRLLGIDSDEKGYDCFNEAKKRIEELLLDKEVVLEYEKEDKDQYGRRLRYIFLDNENINLRLVKEGLAVARFSADNTRYKEEITNAENYARQNKVGCKWQDKEEISKVTSEDQDLKNTSDIEHDCTSNLYNCDDFTYQEQAQEVFEFCGGNENDVHSLDKNNDGVVCTSLPKKR